jgi:hypothetical protein
LIIKINIMLLLDEKVEKVVEALDSDAIKTTHFDVDTDQMDVSSAGDETQSVGVVSIERSGGNGVKLGEKDIAHLMRLLQSYSYKWNPIGLSLGFTQHELNTIFGMLKLMVGVPVSYLQELLSQWIQWPTEEHQNNPTLGALCTALRSSLVGLGGLAEEVEKEMKQYAAGSM